MTISTIAEIAATTCFEFTGNQRRLYRRFLKSTLDWLGLARRNGQ